MNGGDGPRTSTPIYAARVLISKLNGLVALAEDDCALIQDCVLRARDLPSGVRFPAEKRVQQSFVVSGWIGRQRMLADGRRQIVSTVLPGELVGLYPNPLVSMATVSLTDARVADLRPMIEALARAPDRHRKLRAALAIAERIEEAQLAEQVVRLGRRSAMERLGHWLLDVQNRLAAAGLGEGDRFAMPLTQETLGDVLGLSLVHVNRIIQQLRRERLVDVRGGYATILEPERLRMLTEYVPMSTSAPTFADVNE